MKIYDKGLRSGRTRVLFVLGSNLLAAEQVTNSSLIYSASREVHKFIKGKQLEYEAHPGKYITLSSGMKGYHIYFDETIDDGKAAFEFKLRFG